MTKAQRIEAYIKECFETNCINIREFFSNICEGKAYDICWTDKNGMYQNEYARVIRVENTEFKRYNAYYVSITNGCDFDRYSSQIKDNLGVDVDFINLNYDFDKCVALLCAN